MNRFWKFTLTMILSTLGAVLVGVGWQTQEGVSLGEASIGALLTITIIFAISMWMDIQNIKPSIMKEIKQIIEEEGKEE